MVAVVAAVVVVVVVEDGVTVSAASVVTTDEVTDFTTDGATVIMKLSLTKTSTILLSVLSGFFRLGLSDVGFLSVDISTRLCDVTTLTWKLSSVTSLSLSRDEPPVLPELELSIPVLFTTVYSPRIRFVTSLLLL